MGKFIIKKTNTGFIFYLKANNLQTVCTSQVYTSLSGCKAGIESLRKNCNSDIEDQTLQKFEPLKNPKWEIYLDKAGEYRFRLKASNGENIIASQGYTTKPACKNGIASIAKNAPDADVEREEEEKKEVKDEPKKEVKKEPVKKETKAEPKKEVKKEVKKEPVKKDVKKTTKK
jgi:uncharacterized protein YegP (UPF0339 family)